MPSCSVTMSQPLEDLVNQIQGLPSFRFLRQAKTMPCCKSQAKPESRTSLAGSPYRVIWQWVGVDKVMIRRRRSDDIAIARNLSCKARDRTRDLVYLGKPRCCISDASRCLLWTRSRHAIVHCGDRNTRDRLTELFVTRGQRQL